MTRVEQYAQPGGPAIALVRAEASEAAVGVGDVLAVLEDAGFAVCSVPGPGMRTVSGVFEEFSEALDFPDYFGGNKDAFDECMRELDDTVGDAPGYAVVVRHAAELLADEPDEIEWLIDAVGLYEEHYGDADREFRLLLVLPRDGIDAERARWEEAGADVTEIA